MRSLSIFTMLTFTFIYISTQKDGELFTKLENDFLLSMHRKARDYFYEQKKKKTLLLH